MEQKISEKQAEAILRLDPIERYKHSIKTIADWEEAWGLYNNGWALAGDEEKNQFFLLWPAKQYAKLCAEKEWEGYEPKAISLQYLLDDLLEHLKKENINLAIFYTPENQGITSTAEQFEEHLKKELEQYE
jgi:hypothetical protein